MLWYIARRLVQGVLVLLAAVSLVFFALHSSSDPISAELQASGASEEQIRDALRAAGYDRPLFVQYLDFLGDLARGDLGRSLRYGESNLTLIAERMPFTLWLAGFAVLLAIVASAVLGPLSARRPGGATDRIVGTLTSTALAVPSFVVGVLLILVFAVQFRVLPVSGAATVNAVVLPAVALSLTLTARLTRLFRGTLLEVAGSDFITTARAKGVREWRIQLHHLMRNALIPVLTLLALQISALVGGAVVVESVFGWPGIGLLARDALLARDFPLVQAVVVVAAAVVVTTTLLTDLLYLVIDPRIGYR